MVLQLPAASCQLHGECGLPGEAHDGIRRVAVVRDRGLRRNDVADGLRLGFSKDSEIAPVSVGSGGTRRGLVGQAKALILTEA